MLNTYKVTFPTPERATALGIKLLGLGSRTLQFLSGVEFALRSVDSAIQFRVTWAMPVHGGSNIDYKDIYFTTDSVCVAGDIESRFGTYGVEVELIPPHTIKGVR